MKRNDKMIEELSVSEMMEILKKNSYFFIVSIIGSIVIAVLYMHNLPKTYEGSGSIVIGQFLRNTDVKNELAMIFVEDPEIVASRINEGSISGESSNATIIAEVDKKIGKIITLKVNASQPEEAKMLLETVSSAIIEQHARKIEQYKVILNNREAVIKEQLNNFETMEKNYRQGLLQSKNYSEDISLLIEKGRMMEQKNVLEKELSEIELLKSELFLRPTKVMKEVTVNEKIINRKKAYLVFAIFCGGCIAVLGISLKEGIRFW